LPELIAAWLTGDSLTSNTQAPGKTPRRAWGRLNRRARSTMQSAQPANP
jgi:hypothetical protein